MAYKDKTIHNPKVGQTIRFLQTCKDTDGALLEMEAQYDPQSKEPAPHYHPHQAEDFTIVSGSMTVRMDGALRVLKEGDTLHIPRGKVHSMWNHSDAPATVHWKVQPAMETEYFLETVIGLASDGKTDAKGTPHLLQVALMATRYAPVFRLAKPPFVVQKMVFLLLTPLAYLRGYRASYQRYID